MSSLQITETFGDGYTVDFTLSQAFSTVVGITVDDAPVAFTQPAWNRFKLATTPARGASVKFKYLPPSAPASASTGLEIITVRIDADSTDGELVQTIGAYSSPDESIPPYAGSSGYVFKIEPAEATKDLLIIVDMPVSFYPPAMVFLEVKDGYAGQIRVANNSMQTVCLANTAQTRGTVQYGRRALNGSVEGNSLYFFEYEDSTASSFGELRRQTKFSTVVLADQVLTLHADGAVATGSELGVVRLASGSFMPGSVVVEGTPSDTAVYFEMQVRSFTGAGQSETANFVSRTLLPGERVLDSGWGAWTCTSGQYPYVENMYYFCDNAVVSVAVHYADEGAQKLSDLTVKVNSRPNSGSYNQFLVP